MGRLLILSFLNFSFVLLPGVLAGLEPSHNIHPLQVVVTAALCVPGFFVPTVSGYVLPVTAAREELAWASKRDSLLPRKNKGHKHKDASNNKNTTDAATACMAAAMEAAVNQTGVANVTEAVAMSNTTMSAIASACAGNSTDLVQAVAAATNETATAASANVTSDASASNATIDDTSSSTNSSSSSSSSTDAGTGDGSGKGNSNGKDRGKNGNTDNGNNSKNDNDNSDSNSISAVIDDALQVIDSVIGKKSKRDNKYRDSPVRKKWVAGLDEKAF
ncbi:uncharacterized protein Z520_07520 [Fonsecaea multimorphosa CBS 102226]|uniref:Uncharacterized protein n=1 Tax=Fonsecaea multimorphosa CBS 102226 TaxID=1442371 RepID=A0A0D2H4P3_9EURO|nr:uncharacterized protein Z520_07520 [Fonsecaea multimorphosa CBS 102226]KIX96800.1 hypothetical protein Z520_07520 [Fonsecaea multimorphosa CBS 102226]OAL22481.1 hypothetical protein AYO22_07039 [Fonsecaea multimorphosa]